LGILFLVGTIYGIRRIYRDRQPEVYQAKHVDS